jgi:DNA anti-recombination protein RmuC
MRMQTIIVPIMGIVFASSASAQVGFLNVTPPLDQSSQELQRQVQQGQDQADAQMKQMEQQIEQIEGESDRQIEKMKEDADRSMQQMQEQMGGGGFTRG